MGPQACQQPGQHLELLYWPFLPPWSHPVAPCILSVSLCISSLPPGLRVAAAYTSAPWKPEDTYKKKETLVTLILRRFPPNGWI